MGSKKEQISELQDQVGEIKSKLSFLEQDENSPLGQLQTELARVQANIADVQIDQQDSLTDLLDGITSQVAALDKRFDDFAEESARTTETFIEKVTFWWKVIGVGAAVVVVVLGWVVSYPISKIYDNGDRISELAALPNRVQSMETTLNEKVVPQVSEKGILPTKIDLLKNDVNDKLDGFDEQVENSVANAIDNKAGKLEELSKTLKSQQDQINTIGERLDKLVATSEKRIMVNLLLETPDKSVPEDAATKLIFEPREAQQILGEAIDTMRVHSVEYTVREDLGRVPFNINARIVTPKLLIEIATTQPETIRALMAKEAVSVRVYLLTGFESP